MRTQMSESCSPLSIFLFLNTLLSLLSSTLYRRFLFLKIEGALFQFTKSGSLGRWTDFLIRSYVCGILSLFFTWFLILFIEDQIRSFQGVPQVIAFIFLRTRRTPSLKQVCPTMNFGMLYDFWCDMFSGTEYIVEVEFLEVLDLL